MARTGWLLVCSVFIFGTFLFAGALDAKAEKATVLLVLEPKKPSGGNWDIGAGADPIICLKKGCYRGRGFHKSAQFFEGRKILFPTIRAAKCRNSTVCVYRNVDVPKNGSVIEPIDLDGIEHDHLSEKFATVDESCTFRLGKLTCQAGVYAPGYALWVVPEKIAKAAGVKALDFALFKGIQDHKQDFMGDFLRKERRILPKHVASFYSAVIGEEVPRSCSTDPEIISEAFYLAGLVTRGREASELFFEQYMSSVRIAPIVKAVKVQPELFWGLHDAMTTFQKYAAVSVVQVSSGSEGVRYVKNPQGKNSLLVGWQVKSRARALLADCLGRGA